MTHDEKIKLAVRATVITVTVLVVLIGILGNKAINVYRNNSCTQQGGEYYEAMNSFNSFCKLKK